VADDRLRRLQRRFAEAGELDDEVAFLREQVRAGALANDRLELAAYLGHEAATRAWGGDPGRPEADDQRPLERVTRWVEGLKRWGEEALWRAGAAVVRAIPIYADRFDGPDDRLLEVMDRVEDWILAPDEARRAAVDGGPALLAAAVEQAWGAAACANTTHWLCRSVSEEGFAADHTRALVAEAGHELRPLQIERAVRDELVPWALGREDPLLERPRVGGRYLGHEPAIVRRLLPGPGSEVLAVSSRGTLRVWRTDTAEVARELAPLERDLMAMVAAGDRLLSGDAAGRLRLLRADDGRELAGTEGVGDGARDLAVLSGARVGVACRDGTVQVWRHGGDALALERVLTGHSATVNAVTAGEGVLTSGCRDGELRRWDAATLEPLGQPLRHGDEVVRLLALPGRRLVSAGSDRAIWIWQDGQVTTRLEGHTQTVYALAATADGGRLASTGSDGTVRVWDPATGQQLACWYMRGTLLALAFTPVGQLLVGSRRGAIRLYGDLP
jgi:hypothetical protein